MVDKNRAKQLKDFVVEAEEILDGLAEDLERSHEQLEATGKVKPDRLNKIFREMHSLKGLASMFNLERISTLSHDLESLLDGTDVAGPGDHEPQLVHVHRCGKSLAAKAIAPAAGRTTV